MSEMNCGLSADEAVGLYRRMVLIRHFEDEVQRLFLKGLMSGTTHLCQGQEAVAVGVASVLGPGDTMTCTYRGHGHVLAMGASPQKTMAELLGRSDGLCGGKGGSMHLIDVTVGALGSFAIVGAGLPVSAGAALADRYLGTGAVSVAFFGDGATNIGAFHEALNLAAVWSLPVLFVCENNLYGEYSPISWTTPIGRLADRAPSYGIPGVQVDGNDLCAMRKVAGEAAQRARSSGGPTLIEALTYRHKGHSRSDPAKYRPQKEVDEWLTRDPITGFATHLRDELGISPELLESVRVDVAQEVEEITQAALSSPVPDDETLGKDVYA